MSLVAGSLEVEMVSNLARLSADVKGALNDASKATGDLRTNLERIKAAIDEQEKCRASAVGKPDDDDYIHAPDSIATVGELVKKLQELPQDAALRLQTASIHEDCYDDSISQTTTIKSTMALFVCDAGHVHIAS